MPSYEALAKDGVFQTLLTLDENNATVLIDVGWDVFLHESLQELESRISDIDLILLTHPTISHLGAFCLLRHTNSAFASIPCYSTLPVVNIGQMCTIDAYRAQGIVGPFESAIMTEDDIERIFESVRLIKISQPLRLRIPKLEQVVITAYDAGHTLGGAIWKISDGAEFALVAYDWNHSRDAHLRGAFLDSGQIKKQLVKPALMITSTRVSNGSSRRNRQRLEGDISAVIQRGGTVLLPSSTARVLELILIVDELLEEQNISATILLVSHVGQRTLEHASSMLEWMEPSIVEGWQTKNESPFARSRLRFVTDPKQVRNFGGSKVIIAVGEALESGPSREVFTDYIAQSSDSAVILTEECPSLSLGSVLTDIWQPTPQMRQLTCVLPQVNIIREAQLDGPELQQYEAQIAEEDRQEQVRIAQEQRNREILEAAEDEDEEEDAGFQDETLLVGNDFDTSGPGLHMFPWQPKRRRIDDYGEVLLPNEFRVASQVEVKPKPVTKRTWEIPKKERNIPLKRIASKQDVRVICWFDFVDVSGLTDARSISMIMRQIQPARLVATPESSAICEQLKKLNMNNFRVADGTVVKFERTNFSLSLHLDPELEDSLSWHPIAGKCDVARVSGKVEFTAKQEDNSKQSVAVLAPTDVSPPGRHTTIGDIHLSQLRQALIAQGINAEFRSAGVLVCNETITLRFTDGRLVLDGGLESDFYLIKSVIQTFIAQV